MNFDNSFDNNNNNNNNNNNSSSNNTNNSNNPYPQAFHQQLQLQALQQQRQQMAGLTPQKQMQFAQAQAQAQAQVQVGNGVPQNMPNGLTLQQHQQLTAHRLALLKQQQVQHQATAAAQVQQAQAQQLQQHQQQQLVAAAQREKQKKMMGSNSKTPQQQLQIPPPKPWESMRYWSEKLQADGEPANVDVLTFEQLINRDLVNKELLRQERLEKGNKPLLTRLMHDLKYYNDLKLARMKTIQFSNANQYTRSIWGEGYQGYGNGFTDGPTRVLLPSQRKKPSRMRDVYVSKKACEVQAETNEELVPIRLDFDSEKDKFRLRDTFTWDINDKTVSLEQVVATLMEDYRFANPLFADTVLTSVREQVSDYHRHMYNSKFGDDQRIVVKLDITIGNQQLLDQFEWDISNPENNPEQFATVMAEELSLAPEFITAIAHCIREQVQTYTKSLYLIGYDFKGGFIDDDEIRGHISSMVTANDYLRPRGLMPNFTPQILEISNNELERLDKDRERESRRKRRQGRAGRRGGAALPDLTDFPRTFRTPVPSTTLPGGLDLGPDVSSYTEYVETVNRPIPVEEKPIIDETSELIGNAVPQDSSIVGSTGGSVKSTPRQEDITIKKRRVLVNHQPGVKCIVTIKL